MNFRVIFFPLLNNGPKMAEFTTRDVAALQDFASMGCKKIGLTQQITSRNTPLIDNILSTEIVGASSFEELRI